MDPTPLSFMAGRPPTVPPFPAFLALVPCGYLHLDLDERYDGFGFKGNVALATFNFALPPGCRLDKAALRGHQV